LLLVAVTLSATGEQKNVFQWMPNASLPADSVELSPDHQVQEGEFYTDVPAEFVLVKVYQWQPVGEFELFLFVGWQYADADFVNRLHRNTVNL
jgi:hypothetical protein